MAGSITVTTTKQGRLTKYSIAWVSDAAGAVSANTLDVRAGELLQVGFVPDGGGTAPTTLYDVVLNDAAGVDILAGTGANLSATVAAVVVPAVSTYFKRVLEAGTYTPGVTNAGNAKGGIITLLVSPV